MLRFLFHVGRAVAHQGLAEVAKAIADPTLASAGDLLGKIAFDAWDGLRKERKQDRLNADILEAARMDAEEIRRQAAEIAAAVAPNDPELAGHVERFVTLVPAGIRATLRRAEDPTGTTLPAGFAVEDESDIVKFLPVRFPRPHFRPGYAPPFLRGWELVRQLGAGGFGEVWQVRNLRANQLVGAVKFGHALNDAELSLLNEGDVLNRLLAAGKHPGLVELQDVWADGDEVPWIRYEYVPGGDLTDLIRRWSARPLTERVSPAVAAFRQLCETVGHFHRLTPSPIVHRDLKPSNILVAADGRLKVADFGIGSISSKRTLDGERRGTLSRTNTVQAYLRGAHTPLYAPPEQKFDPKHKPRPTDDVHALGVILFQMLTGRLDAAPGARFDRELAGVPQPLIDLIGDCVESQPGKRPADAAAVLARLPAVAPPPPRPVTPPPEPPAEPRPAVTPAAVVPASVATPAVADAATQQAKPMPGFVGWFLLLVGVGLLALYLWVFSKNFTSNPTYTTVRGAITLDNKPLTSGVVEFHAEDGSGSTSTEIGADGRYILNKVTVGPNRVKVWPPSPLPDLDREAKGMEGPTFRTDQSVPAKYNTNTELRFTAKPGEQTHDLNLTR